MRLLSKGAMLALSLLAGQDAKAADTASGRLLADAMKVSQSVDDALAMCEEKAVSRDVEKDVADTPHLLGGVMPEDAEWPEVKALYLEMLKAGCAFDRAAAEQAYVDTLGQSLSAADIDALLAFYRSDLGERFLEATLEANNASGRSATPLPKAETAYEEFAKSLQSVLERRNMHVSSTAQSPRVIHALTSMDDTVATNDRMMKAIVAGDVRGALESSLPHAAVTAEQVEALIVQIEEQAPVRSQRYGLSIDYELLRNDMIGDSLIRTVFLHRFDRHAVAWQFVWYRGDDGWVLSNMRYADDLDALFR